MPPTPAARVRSLAAASAALVFAIAFARAADGPPAPATPPTPTPAGAAKGPASLPTTRVNVIIGAADELRDQKQVTTPIELVRIPAGTITLTDDKGHKSEHRVKSIWVARYETNWPVFYAFAWCYDQTEAERQTAKDHGRRLNFPFERPDAFWGVDGMPANNIPRSSAEKFCQWLSAQTKRKFRRPTEAEWEYACRAGGPPIKLAGKELDAAAWYDENSEDQPHPVGRKKPNAWGLYDMLGNVAEQVITPDGTEVIAGGSYKDDAADVHSGAREAKSPKWTYRDPESPPRADWYDYGSAHHIGFRVVMEE